MNKNLGLIVWLLSVSVWAFAQTTGSPCTTECVFPGDANNDRIVSKSDILAIGLTYGYQGTGRPNASPVWQPQSCTPWNGMIPNTTINSKYTDCNGNGQVSANDFDLVFQNYGQTHSFVSPPYNLNTSGGVRSTNALDVRLVIQEDSISIDTDTHIRPFEADIFVGNSSFPASDLYGLAFTILYDPTQIAAAPLQVNYINNWFSAPLNTKVFTSDNRTAGQLDIAITRLNHQSAYGNGRIARISGGVIGENIHGRNAGSYLRLGVINVEGVGAAGIAKTMIGIGDSVRITTFTPVLRASNNNLNLQLAPNPVAIGQPLFISGLNTAFNYQISDVLGRILKSEQQATVTEIVTDGLPEGSYFLLITTEKGTSTQQFYIK